MTDVVARLREFMENEMRSCSMDIGGIIPLYVHRMWGGKVPFEEIKAEKGLDEIMDIRAQTRILNFYPYRKAFEKALSLFRKNECYNRYVGNKCGSFALIIHKSERRNCLDSINKCNFAPEEGALRRK